MKIGLLLLFASVLAHAGGDETHNGAGGGEFYVTYARQSLSRIFDTCLASPRCRDGLDSELRVLLIRKPWERTEFRFLTKHEMGSTLYQRFGTVLEINKDALHKNSPRGSRPWELPDALGFLVTVYGSDLGLKSQVTEKLRGRIVDLASVGSRSSVISGAGYEQFSFAAFGPPLSTLIIEDLQGLSDSFEVPFANQLECSFATEVPEPIRDVRIESAFWGLVDEHSTRSYSVLLITGRLAFACPDGNGALKAFRSNYRVTIAVRPEKTKQDHRWIMDRSTLFIEQSAIQELKP